jgi:hypothetical protein
MLIHTFITATEQPKTTMTEVSHMNIEQAKADLRAEIEIMTAAMLAGGQDITVCAPVPVVAYAHQKQQHRRTKPKPSAQQVEFNNYVEGLS